MCIHRTGDGKCKKFSDENFVSYCVDGPCPDDTPTNADRIRAMSDEDKREALIDYFSQWAGVGDSYVFDLGSVKSAFGCGTMSFEDFTEWDESRIAELVDEFLDFLRQPAEEGRRWKN